MGRRNNKGRSRDNYEPDPAIGYKFKYENADGDRRVGIKIFVKEDLREGDVLVGFANDYKESKKHPDFAFKVEDEDAGSKRGRGRRRSSGGSRGRGKSRRRDDDFDNDDDFDSDDGYDFG